MKWLLALVLALPGLLSAAPALAQDVSRTSVGTTASIFVDTLTWELVGEPVDGEGLFADTARGTVYAIGGEGLFVIHPGETSWTLLATNDGDELDNADQGVFVSHQGTLFANGYHGLRRSANGGRTWEDAFDEANIAPTYTPAGALITNRDETGGNIGRSADDGVSWTIIKTFDTIPFGFFPWAFASLPLSETLPQGRLVAAGGDGIAYSDDDGFTWHESNVFGAFAYRSVSVICAPWTLDDAASTGTLYAQVNGAGIAGGLYESTNGATWHLVGQIPEVGDSGAHLVAVGGEGDSVLFALPKGLRDRSVVYHSIDRGRTWASAGVLPTEGVLDARPIPSELAVGPEGRLWAAVAAVGPPKGAVFRTAEAVVPVGVERPEVPGGEPGETALEVWPNPVREIATVALTLSIRSVVRVGIFDVLGREIVVLHEGDLAAGAHRFSFEAEGLPVGVYFVRADVVTSGHLVTRAQAFSLAR